MKLTLVAAIAASLLVGSVLADDQQTNQNSQITPNAPSNWRQSQSTTDTNQSSDADNTSRNVRDRNSSSVTPMDQGNSQADLNTTAQIRKQVIANKNMSINAQNVKIITANGHVVLRGPVNSTDEKKSVCQIAKNIAGAQNVEDDLEVTAPRTY